MSYTITSGKKAAVKKLADGRVIYALFENLTESNVYPLRAHWSCVALGELHQVVAVVVQRASACPGGSLQKSSGHDGWLTPESYIFGWRLALSNPTELLVGSVDVIFRQKLLTSNDDSLDQTRQILLKHGMPELAEAICNDGIKVELSFIDNIELLLDLYCPDGPMPPWYILNDWHCGDDSTIINVTETTDSEYDPPLTLAYKLPYGGVLVKNGDMPWQFFGQIWKAEESYLLKVIIEAEQKIPRISKRMIRKFREICEGAPPLPLNTFVSVSITGQTSAYTKQNMELCLAKMGIPIIDGKAQFLWEAAIKSYGLYEPHSFMPYHDVEVIWQVEDSEHFSTPRPVVVQESLDLAV